MDDTILDEPAMPDAAIMGDTIDDLFGEAADVLNVALPSAPLPAGLILRIAQMQGRGCCT